MKTEVYIRKHIQKILLEQEQADQEKKKSGKIRSVGVGRGRLKFSITETGALAKEDPAKLMKNLKVGSVDKSKDQIKMLQGLLEAAAANTEEMSEVFSVSSNQPKAKDKNGNVLESVAVKVSIIPLRDAQKYIEFTVLGATNAFDIKWKKDVEVTQSGDNVVVFLR